MLIIFKIIVLSSLAMPVIAADCEQAKMLLDKGVRSSQANQWVQTQQWLKQSVALCQRFENGYLLGQAEVELKHYHAALMAFSDARSYARTEDERALAMARYAEVLALQNEIGRPLALLHQARKLHSKAPAWIAQLAMKLDSQRASTPVTLKELTRSLDNRSMQLFAPGSNPSYDLSLRFKTDSVELLPESKLALTVIANALKGDVFIGKKFTLTGHADKRGTEMHNCQLSIARSKSIVIKLLEIQPMLIGRLLIAGSGEYAPLYDGDDEAVFRLNRRLEIMLNYSETGNLAIDNSTPSGQCSELT